MGRLPPHNQRRLNVRIAETYGDKYADWFQLAIELQSKGATFAEIASIFTELGVTVGLLTVRNWMLHRANNGHDCSICNKAQEPAVV